MLKRIRHHFFKNSILLRMLIFLLTSVIAPMMALNFIYLNLTYRDMQRQAIHSFTSLNRQAVVNLDAMVDGVGLYSVYPYYNDLFSTLLAKDYTSAEGRKEVTSDFRGYQSAVHTQIMRYNSYVYGSLLYNAKSNLGFVGGYDMDSLRDPIMREMDLARDTDMSGSVVRLVQKTLPHHDETDYYILIGRHLFSTSTREYLGFFSLVVPQDVLKMSFSQEGELEGIRQYLVDDRGIILYSPSPHEVGKPAILLPIDQHEALEGQATQEHQNVTMSGSRAILTRDALHNTSWEVVGVIDEGSLFASLQTRQRIWTAMFVAITTVSVLVVSLVAFSVSRPIRTLNNTMGEIVKSHDFATRVQSQGHDEISELAQSFNLLLEEIQRLLDQVMQRENEKRLMEYKALQAQVNPHFLGNTLNTIKWMANMQCADNISEAVDSLIHLMNYALDGERRSVCVSQELEFTRRYIQLMELRYFGAFDLEWDIDEAALDCEAIRFMLQPLVDNAIFHGLQDNTRRNLLRISVQRLGGLLEFHVWDNGVGMDTELISQILSGSRKKERGFNSIGVYNVAQRIKMHFGDAYGLEIDSRPGNHTDVKLVLPAMPIVSEEEL